MQMTTSENNTNALYVEWKDPKKELPDANSHVLAAFSWSGCAEDYGILYFDGKDWRDDYGCSLNVLGWMPIPRLPEDWITNRNVN